ncbi:MAG: SUMF1/EgtB/PvdO family nonheme iron enzyme [Cyanobacteria bacterium J06649_5]
MARNWAITVGINHYSFLQPLNYAMQDADSIYQLFTKELDFHKVYRFTDKSAPIQQDYGRDLDSKPTRANLRRFLRNRFKKPFLGEGDNLWFFFAGHGVRSRNRDYLMPLDGDRSDLSQSAIAIHYISERLRRSGADNIILIIDACRSGEGRRSGLGIGQEKQQGVITLFACSPEESSYEIQELQQGAFTHVFLESLRIQGEGNCATVERLYQRLRYYVPQLTQQYKRGSQTPYGVIEPLSKNHLILLPREVTLSDIEALKKDALTAEIKHNSKVARQIWIRVLAVSPADPEAIEGIERLSRTGGKHQLASPPTPVKDTLSISSNISHPPASSRAANTKKASSTDTKPDTKKASSTDTKPDQKSAVPVLRSSKGPTLPESSETEIDELVERIWSGSNKIRQKLGLEEKDFPEYLNDRMDRRQVLQGLAATVIATNIAVWLGEPLLSRISSPEAADSRPSRPLTVDNFTLFNCDVIKIDEHGKTITQATNRVYGFQENINSIPLELVAIPAGTLQMGSSSTEADRDLDKKPQHEVTVSSFLIGKYPVTQAQWKAIVALPKVDRRLRTSPSYFEAANFPVEQVSWDDAVEFCKRLSKVTGRKYRLPNEAEWEYACRAGSTTPFHFGKTLTSDVANYNATQTYEFGPKGIYRDSTTEVGIFPSNAFGLYDMHGNVWEWCSDYWHRNYESAPNSGVAWTEGGDEARRVSRGGAWQLGPDYCRSAKRYGWKLNSRSKVLGFRVVCESSWTL